MILCIIINFGWMLTMLYGMVKSMNEKEEKADLVSTFLAMVTMIAIPLINIMVDLMAIFK